ncbi:MAG TPA: NAD(P)H-hydrate dehydratase, partial [Caulobacteraceae bacterium]|nr:NAD(P)H-hydrate dehydratase [Caulobacteraceae bacterium]
PAFAAHLEAAMLKTFETAGELEGHAREMQAFVIGPAAGLSDATRENVAALARAGPALVVDADAITIFKDDPQALFALLDDRDVMTPHTGEFERLFPGLLEGGGRIEAAREAARRAGCVVVLKGGESVIAAPDGRTAVNTHATPWLATAGSGDVLCGAIGGLLAGRMDAFDAACAGVWMHGDAGLRVGPGLTAEDLPGALRAVVAELHALTAPQQGGSGNPGLSG